MNQPGDYRGRQRANLIVMAIIFALIAATVALLVPQHHGSTAKNASPPATAPAPQSRSSDEIAGVFPDAFGMTI